MGKDHSLRFGSWSFDFLSRFGKIQKNITGLLTGIKPGQEGKKIGPESCQQGVKRDHEIQPRALAGC